MQLINLRPLPPQTLLATSEHLQVSGEESLGNPFKIGLDFAFFVFSLFSRDGSKSTVVRHKGYVANPLRFFLSPLDTNLYRNWKKNMNCELVHFQMEMTPIWSWDASTGNRQIWRSIISCFWVTRFHQENAPNSAEKLRKVLETSSVRMLWRLWLLFLASCVQCWPPILY